MALLINEACIICHACESECPNNAIYAPGESWTYSEGTMLKGVIERDNKTIESSTTMAPIVNNSNGINGALFYYIAPDKCTECVGFHEEPSCALVCPVDVVYLIRNMWRVTSNYVQKSSGCTRNSILR